VERKPGSHFKTASIDQIKPKPMRSASWGHDRNRSPGGGVCTGLPSVRVPVRALPDACWRCRGLVTWRRAPGSSRRVVRHNAESSSGPAVTPHLPSTGHYARTTRMVQRKSRRDLQGVRGRWVPGSTTYAHPTAKSKRSPPNRWIRPAFSRGKETRNPRPGPARRTGQEHRPNPRSRWDQPVACRGRPPERRRCCRRHQPVRRP
jgi:hypothetical protein